MPHHPTAETLAELLNAHPAPNATAPDPGFPIHTLPQPIAAWLNQTAYAVRVPVALTAAPFLAFTGATIGNQLHLNIAPGWNEHPTLWIALVTLTGTGKTPALSAVREPFNILHHHAWQTWQANPKYTPFNRLIARGVSYASLTNELHGSTGLIVVRDELYGLVRGMDRRRGEDRQHFLTLWSSEPIIPANETHASFIQTPVVNIVGGIQPTLIPKLRAKDQDGFLERFILLFIAGIQPQWRTATQPAPAETIAEYIRPLRHIHQEGAETASAPVTLTPQAETLWETWFNTHIDHLFAATLTTGGFYRKLPSHLLRIALILHALWNPQNPTTRISETTIQHAIDLAEYIRHHIHRAGMLISEWSPLISAQQALATRILRALQTTTNPDRWITRTDLLHLVGRPPTASIDTTLTPLIENGIIETNRTRPTGHGRYTTTYRLAKNHP